MRYTITGSSFALLLLAGCVGKVPPPKIEKVFVNVPTVVATGCIAAIGRPDPVKPMDETITADQWKALAPGAKAQAVSAQAGKRLDYEDTDRAATSGCK